MMGEIGGTDEQEAAAFVKKHMTKPVIGFIAGQTAPPGRRMGHAGAIISGSSGTAEEKLEAFRKAGMGIAKRPRDFVELLQAALGSRRDASRSKPTAQRAKRKPGKPASKKTRKK